ncbi:MAG: carbohydrate-binding protein [Bacteroidota bacterium]
MKSYILISLVFLGFLGKSKPYNGKPQMIPGKVECEFYNIGGEDNAYHDSDKINNGSGKLNPANGTFLNEFRMNEGVDLSYTKEKNIDNTIYNKVQPEMNSLYVGWTVPGEWIKYDVVVAEDGEYSAELMYTANGDGEISIELDGKEVSPARILSTNNPADTIAWRQWHHWDKVNIADLELRKGKHTLRLIVVGNGNMNFDYIEFKRQ